MKDADDVPSSGGRPAHIGVPRRGGPPDAEAATELTLLGEEPSAALVLRSSRRQPGLLVQGDTLSIVTQAAEDMVHALGDGDVEEARLSAGVVAEALRNSLTTYERMMRAAGRELPYSQGEAAPQG